MLTTNGSKIFINNEEKKCHTRVIGTSLQKRLARVKIEPLGWSSPVISNLFPVIEREYSWLRGYELWPRQFTTNKWGKKARLKNNFKCLYNEVARHRECEERPLLAPAQDNKARIVGDRNSRFAPSQFAY